MNNGYNPNGYGNSGYGNSGYGNSPYSQGGGYPGGYPGGGGYPPPAKEKLVAGLLALFVGYLGIQYFYIGKTTAGIITLILGLCSCGIVSIISFIQGIYILTLSQQEFERKYVYTSSSFPIF